MKYIFNEPTMVVKQNGNVINNSGVPVTSINIVTNPCNCDYTEFMNTIDANLICKYLDKIDWEYLLGTGHWTPRLNDVVHITPDILKYYINKLYQKWIKAHSKNITFKETLYSGISTYYYCFILKIKNNKMSLTINF